ncbi:MAG: hypothetical protein AAFR97_08060, partial [Bacteroidota bacterium]
MSSLPLELLIYEDLPMRLDVVRMIDPVLADCLESQNFGKIEDFSLPYLEIGSVAETFQFTFSEEFTCSDGRPVRTLLAHLNSCLCM